MLKQFGFLAIFFHGSFLNFDASCALSSSNENGVRKKVTICGGLHFLDCTDQLVQKGWDIPPAPHIAYLTRTYCSSGTGAGCELRKESSPRGWWLCHWVSMESCTNWLATWAAVSFCCNKQFPHHSRTSDHALNWKNVVTQPGSIHLEPMHDNLTHNVSGHGYCHPARRLLLWDDILAFLTHVGTGLWKMWFNLKMLVNFNRRNEISRPLANLYANTDVIKKHSVRERPCAFSNLFGSFLEIMKILGPVPAMSPRDPADFGS